MTSPAPHRPLAWAGSIAATLALVACASSTRPTSYDAPPDFALSVTMLQPPGARDASLPAGWFVLEHDNQLRAAAGQRAAEATLPTIVRHLSDREIADLWHSCSAAGFTGQDAPAARPGGRDIPPAHVSAPTALVYVQAQGRRRSFQVDLSARDDSYTLGAAELVQRLASLAGMSPRTVGAPDAPNP